MRENQLPVPSQIRAKTPPLLKWPGGKRALLKHIIPLIPSAFGRYYEPFFGGGALFFAIQPTDAILADNNEDLMNCYAQVREHPENVIRHLSALRNTKEDYFAIRARTPEDPVKRAARLIYLVTLSFNGIHRLNLKGQFNVPYGQKTHLQPCDPSKIRASSSALASAQFFCSDFELVLSKADCGDLVYLDPPYTVAHGDNGFIKYNSKIFAWDDQIRLAKVAIQLAKRGCTVIVSNADHPSIRELYSCFSLEVIQRRSVIAASRDSRRQITECLFYHLHAKSSPYGNTPSSSHWLDHSKL